ncbi:MAG: trehalose-6-phosphate synthase [Nitrospirae bacterium]|nr:trehalose-6-phosphate synthase [Nitrospirota bacterium]MCL5286245.1 trehalose-6-phosphate synthase [Nitrospirota bacterium]
MSISEKSPTTQGPAIRNTPRNWTALTVSERFRSLFGTKKLLVATHREPIIYQASPKAPSSQTEPPKLRYPAGGVSQSLHRLLLQTGGDWVSLRNSPGPPTLPISLPGYPASYTLYRLTVPESPMEEGYQRFSNDLLWPLFHEEPGRVGSTPGDFSGYEAVNRLFAEHISRVATDHENGVLWIHDYQLSLVAKWLRSLVSAPLPPVAFFWHIPWPRQEFLTHLPERRLLLEGLLDYDFIGFQTALYRERFLESIEREFGDDSRVSVFSDHILKGSRRIHVGDYPIGVDPGRFERLSLDPQGQADARGFLCEQGITHEEDLLISVDRMDYTKGFLKRLQILDSLFTTYPERVGRIRLLQIAPLTRSTHPTYQSYQKKVRETVKSINDRWKKGTWVPVISVERTVEHRILAPLYRLAKGALVTSTNDGMNLVAKEYLAAQKDEGGTLFLSRYTGAAQGLREAVLIDPFDPSASAAIINRALMEPVSIRKGRNKILREQISRNNIYQWMGSILTGIHEAKRKEE